MYVVRTDQARPSIKFPSGVSGRELLEIVHEDFGPGRVEGCQGVTVVQSLSTVPDGSYTFFPKQSGKLYSAADT